MALSTEAIEDLALRVRVDALVRTRARSNQEPHPPTSRPDASPLGPAHAVAVKIDAALATFVAEAAMLALLDAPLEKYARAWREEPVTLRGETPIDVRALATVLAAEPNEHRRAATAKAADDQALEHLGVARAVVDGFRGVADTLALAGGAPAIPTALGWGSPEAIARAGQCVLDATADVYREVEAWVRGRVGLPRSGELRWSDRVRLLASQRATELIPLGDRIGIASRWLTRIGLESELSRVRDLTRPGAAAPVGVFASNDEPGSRATLFGTPGRSACGTVDFAGVTFEAVVANTANEPRVSSRAGIDRVHGAIARVLARRNFLEPTFLFREAAVDRGACEPVLLELLHADLFETRLCAARGLFGLDVLSRGSDLPARYREHLQRALGSAPLPTWAAHECASWTLTTPGATTLALALEPQLRAVLRDRFDEDWFRNPRTGESMRDRFAMMRSEGTVAAFARMAAVTGDDPNAVIDGRAIGAWSREVFHRATAR